MAMRLPKRFAGALVLALALFATFLMMANVGRLPRGPIWGIVTMLIAAGALLEVLGILRPAEERMAASVPWTTTALAPREGELRWLAPIYTFPAAILTLIRAGMATGVEQFHYAVGLALLPLAASALRRPGLIVFTVTVGLYLPFLGNYGLWDPWETHYGEVAREILSRDDWISLWWAQENWFWSKPILIFWSEALSMGILGTDYRPDANPAHPEWAIRLPIFIMATGAVMSAFAAMRHVFGARTGVVAALVLATMPHFFLLSHQAITDMPFVSNMTMAMSMLILALAQPPDRTVRDVRFGKVVLGGQHAIIAAIFMLAAPQALYLASRNVAMVRFMMFAWGKDEFLHGSAGNAGVPGNAALDTIGPVFDGIAAQPLSQGLIWGIGLALVLFFLKRERRTHALLMAGFYVFAGLAFMGKGIPGFGLPGAITLLYLIASRRWDVLIDGRLRIALGAVIVMVVGFPWYVAMYIRHGAAFTDRLLVHDHINRLAQGVHGDTGSVEYFVEQLGAGMFPWVALIPVAATLFLWETMNPAPVSDDPAVALEQKNRRETLSLITLWFTANFVLFNAMITKFHHYIFPVVPPAALLIGALFARAVGAPSAETPRNRYSLGTILAALAPGPIVLGAAGLIGHPRGVIPAEHVSNRDWVLENGWGASGALLIVLGLALAGGAWWLLRSVEHEASSKRTITVAAISATVVLVFVGRDLSWVTDARPYGYERLIHLFIYNYGRLWPDYLDYRPIFTGFAAGAVVLFAALAFVKARAVASRAILGLAIVFAAWSLNVYLIDLSPHWGQQVLLKRYYAERAGPEEPLVAWQMNWKGENFYSGNRVSVFADLDNTKLNEWVAERRGKRVFFLLEHGRLANLRSVLGSRTVTEVTTMRDCNKFLLVEAML